MEISIQILSLQNSQSSQNIYYFALFINLSVLQVSDVFLLLLIKLFFSLIIYHLSMCISQITSSTRSLQVPHFIWLTPFHVRIPYLHLNLFQVLTSFCYFFEDQNKLSLSCYIQVTSILNLRLQIIQRPRGYFTFYNNNPNTKTHFAILSFPLHSSLLSGTLNPHKTKTTNFYNLYVYFSIVFFITMHIVIALAIIHTQ